MAAPPHHYMQNLGNATPSPNQLRQFATNQQTSQSQQSPVVQSSAVPTNQMDITRQMMSQINTQMMNQMNQHYGPNVIQAAAAVAAQECMLQMHGANAVANASNVAGGGGAAGGGTDFQNATNQAQATNAGGGGGGGNANGGGAVGPAPTPTPPASVAPATAAPPQQQQQAKEFNTASLCRIGQETVQDIVSRTQEVFQTLKAMQPLNGTPQSTNASNEKKAKVQELLRTIRVLFKRLRLIYEKCNENCQLQGMEYTHIESLIPFKDELDPKYDEKKNSESYRTACEESKEVMEQVILKNKQLKEVIDHLRRIIWEINTMLTMRRS